MPEAAVADHRDRPLVGFDIEGGGRGRAEPVAHRGRADIERRQRREQVAADIGGDVVFAELLLHELHGGEDRPLRTADTEAGRPRRHRLGERLDLRIGQHRVRVRRRRRIAEQRIGVTLEKCLQPLGDDHRRVFTGHRQHVLAADPGLDVAAAQDGVDRLLDEFRLALLDDQDRLLVRGKFGDLVVDQRIGDVEHIDRHRRLAIDVGETKLLQRAHHRIVEAALHHDADIGVLRAKEFVELALLDEFDGGRPALLDLLALVQIRRRRQHDPLGVAARLLQGFAQRKARLFVVLGDETAVDVAGADAHFEHDRRMRHFRKLKAVFHRLDDRRQIGPWIEEPHLRFHGERMRAFLHDRGAFAVVLTDDDQRAAGNAAGREIGDGIGRDIDADRSLEGDRAADRIVHGSRERRRSGRLGRRVLEMDAELVEHVLGVGEHVHQMRDRRALVAADIGYAGLQQRLGDRENAFAAKLFALAQFEIFDLASKRTFSHGNLQAVCGAPAGRLCDEL